MLVYLWHVPAMTLMIGVGLLWPEVLLPASTSGWWMVRPVWFVLSGVMLAGLVWAALRWELWFARFEPTRSTVRGVLGSLVAGVAVHEIWQQGVGITPAQLLWEGLFVLSLLLLTGRRSPA